MNINIAFNTIIYIMVFLFPGILFRKAFFSAKFGKHFDYGSAFERIAWAIIFSFICILLFTFLNNHIGNYPQGWFDSLKCINHKVILQNFKSMYSNSSNSSISTPTFLDNVTHLRGFSALFIMLYFFSYVLGLLCYWIVFFFEIDRRFSILKYQNSWNYLLGSSRTSNSQHKFMSLYYSRLNILTKNQELFDGRFLDIIVDKDNKIEAISMFESYKFIRLERATETEKIEEIMNDINVNSNHNYFIHLENDRRVIVKKKIHGDVFSLLMSNIENVSIKYIQITNFSKRLEKAFQLIAQIFIYGTVLFSVYDLFVIQLDIFKMQSNFKTILFHGLAPINILMLFILFHYTFFSLDKGKKYFKELVSILSVTISSFIFYFYIYWDWKLVWPLVLIFLILLLTSIIRSQINIPSN